jgi:hypothetical protein
LPPAPKRRIVGPQEPAIWGILPAFFPAEHVPRFEAKTFLGRPAEPGEIAPSYIFLASDDARLHDRPGAPPQHAGEIVGG